jgi:quercetin 2,3-dioxygenase
MRVTTLDPGIKVVRADSRLRTETSWLDSRHCFSYGRHYEPDNTHHGLLLVCNDDRLRGSTGFAEHTHQEMEIVTWMVEGELEHRDCGGGGGAQLLRPGQIRRLSAGAGVRHSDMNPAGWAPARYIEMWVPPDREAPPSVEVADVSTALDGGGIVPVASGAGHEGAVTLHQHQAVLWAGRLELGEAVILPDAPHLHLFVVLGGGVLDTGGLAGAGPLEECDSVRLTAAGSPTFTARPAGFAEILVWETG